MYLQGSGDHTEIVAKESMQFAQGVQGKYHGNYVPMYVGVMRDIR